ncbi:MAG: hypothetical protein COA78_03935 [Blastopirellula sp.]|nr:MAG: hypothetical protein COA78_03935 [Blastopirellula sp.]
MNTSLKMLKDCRLKSASLLILLLLCSCNANNNWPGSSGNGGIQVSTIDTDLSLLKKLINVPEIVNKCKFQTYSRENDWSLIAIIESPENIDIQGNEKENNLISFGLPEIPNWVAIELEDTFTKDSKGLYRSSSTIYEPTGFTKGSLLHGVILQDSENRILLFLYTT